MCSQYLRVPVGLVSDSKRALRVVMVMDCLEAAIGRNAPDVDLAVAMVSNNWQRCFAKREFIDEVVARIREPGEVTKASVALVPLSSAWQFSAVGGYERGVALKDYKTSLEEMSSALSESSLTKLAVSRGYRNFELKDWWLAPGFDRSSETPLLRWLLGGKAEEGVSA